MCAVTTGGDDERSRALRMSKAEVKGCERAHRQADHVGPLYLEMVEQRQSIGYRQVR